MKQWSKNTPGIVRRSVWLKSNLGHMLNMIEFWEKMPTCSELIIHCEAALKGVVAQIVAELTVVNYGRRTPLLRIEKEGARNLEKERVI